MQTVPATTAEVSNDVAVNTPAEVQAPHTDEADTLAAVTVEASNDVAVNTPGQHQALCTIAADTYSCW